MPNFRSALIWLRAWESAARRGVNSDSIRAAAVLLICAGLIGDSRLPIVSCEAVSFAAGVFAPPVLFGSRTERMRRNFDPPFWRR